MANKKITDLQLRSAVTDDLNVPSDDGVQSYRVTAQQFKDYILPLNAIATDRIQDGAVTLAKLASLVQSYLMPVATVLPYMGSTPPSGYLLCDGQAVSRSTYSALFAVIGTAGGSGDGSTTFNIPDLRGMFLRGSMPNISATGSGSASGNNAVFTSHGFNRTGMRVRMTAGALTGLVTATSYYIIVIDANTLAFATTAANALAGTKITISGTNTAVISQWVNADVTSRIALAPGGNTGVNFGSFEEDAVQDHWHYNTESAVVTNGGNAAGGSGIGTGSGSNTNKYINDPAARKSSETKSINVSVNYIIKT